MTDWTITRKDATLVVRKDGEHYAKTPVQSKNAVEVYTELGARLEYWAVLRDYYLAGAPKDYNQEVEHVDS